LTTVPSGRDGAGTNVADVYAGVLPVIRDFDIGKLAAFLGEDLDADIVVFGGRAGGILAVNLAVEVDGGSAGGFGLTGHFEVGGGRLAASRRPRWWGGEA